VELYIRVVGITIILITIFRGALIAFRIVVDVVSLAYVRFAVGIVIVLRSIYYKNKNERRITLDTKIMIGF
jgi:hypothetical protein